MVNELKIGQKAPHFSLLDQKGEVVDLVNLRGNWLILYFYPKDDTPGCTIEANDFTRYIKEFDSLNAVVCGVSPDSIESHCTFIGKYGLRIKLLSDVNHEVCEKFGVWRLKKMYDKEYFGVYRSTFIISPESTVSYLEYGVKADGHAEEVLRKLRELGSK